MFDWSDAESRRRGVAPTAAQGLDELNGGDEALARKLGVGALGLQGVPAGIHDLDVADDAGPIAIRRRDQPRGGRW